MFFGLINGETDQTNVFHTARYTCMLEIYHSVMTKDDICHF